MYTDVLIGWDPATPPSPYIWAIRKIERNVGPSYVFADSYGIWSGVPLPAGLQTNNSLKRLGHEIEYQYANKKEYFVV